MLISSLSPIESKIARSVGQSFSFEAFQLQYHEEATKIQVELLGCGRKFMHPCGAHHFHCNGKDIYMCDGDVVQVHIDIWDYVQR